MKPTVLESKRPAAIDAGEYPKLLLTMAGLRQHVTASKRLMEEFELMGNSEHPDEHVLAWGANRSIFIVPGGK